MKRALLATCIPLLAVVINGVAQSSRQRDLIPLDSFGGVLALKGTTTGRFHLEKLNGRHCLVTPNGHGFFSLGIVHTAAVSRQGDKEIDLFEEQFGRNWNQYSAATLANLRQWGYNTIGYDSPGALRQMLPYLVDCYPAQTSSWRPNADFSYPDVFDPKWEQYARARIRKMVEGERGNPNLIGYYWTDIPQWDIRKARRDRGTDWVSFIRGLPETSPGKEAYKQFLARNDGEPDDEEFLRIIASTYYRVLGEETRKLDPDTLIFGERYLFSDCADLVIKEALPWIDALAFQPGGAKFDAPLMDHLHEISGKPILLCDHQASFPTPRFPKTMWQQLPSQEDVGKAHAQYLQDALARTYILGYHRCQYIDRFKPDQGILKQGLLREDGRPYETLVRTVTENNRAVLQEFAGGK